MSWLAHNSGRISGVKPRGRVLSAPGQSGAILIVVLWVVVILSLMVSTFAVTMHIEMKLTAYHDRELKARALALAGIEYEKTLLAMHVKGGQITSSDGVVRQFSSAGADYYSEPWHNNSDLVDHKLGDDPANDGSFTVQVLDEQSRLSVNVITPEQWHTLLQLAGVDSDTANIITDSVGDWMDKDSEVKMNGAEDDYYMSLSPKQGGPYHCKNGNLDSVEELLLIRGVTPEIFYGHQAESHSDGNLLGIGQFLNALPFTKVNVNTASSQVLQCLPGVTAQMAEQLISYRQGQDGVDGTDDDKPFQDVGEISTVWGGTMTANEMKQFAQYVGVKSSFFTIYSTGKVGPVSKTIVTTIYRADDGTFSTLSWNELSR